MGQTNNKIFGTINQLEELVSELDIPFYRRRDYNWLYYNISPECVEESFFKEMMRLINKIKLEKKECMFINLQEELGPYEE